MKKIILAAATILLISALKAQITFTLLPTLSSQPLLGISFANADTGYACGFSGTLLKTTDGGASWITLVSGTTKNLFDIKVAPGSMGQKVITVGDNNTVLKSTDGGGTWLAQTIPFQSGSFVNGLQCLDSLNYFACGGDFATFSGSVLKTSDGGATWTKSAVPGSVFLDKIFMRNLTVGFTAGSNTSFTDGSIHKTVNATSWPAVKTSSAILTNVWCNSNTNVFSIGLAGQIWKSINAGTSWTSQAVDTTDLYGIQFTDSLTGFVCGGSSSGSTILTTTNGGLSWTKIPYAFNGILESVCIVGKSIFIAGDQGTIIKATLPTPSINTGIVGIQQGELQPEVYPNPTSNKINIDLKNELNLSAASFILTDVQGRAVKEIYLTNAMSQIEVNNLAPGIYTYRIISGNNIIKRDKLVIE